MSFFQTVCDSYSKEQSKDLENSVHNVVESAARTFGEAFAKYSENPLHIVFEGVFIIFSIEI